MSNRKDLQMQKIITLRRLITRFLFLLLSLCLCIKIFQLMVQQWGKNYSGLYFCSSTQETKVSQIKFLFCSLTSLSGRYGEKIQWKKSKLHRNGTVQGKREEVNLRTMNGKSKITFPCALCAWIYQESSTEYICKLLASNRHLNHISPFCHKCVMISDFNSQKKSTSKKGQCYYILPPLPEGFFIFYFIFYWFIICNSLSITIT